MESPPAIARLPRAAAFGVAAAIPVAVAYGVLADPFGVSWGLIVVGLIGGWLIGQAVAHGGFNGRFHLVVPRVRWLAALIAILAWVAAVVVAYVASQVFYQGATTPLGERVSVAGFFEYLNGTVFSPTILGLAGMAFSAWRGAR